jgi:uncharacterized protein YrrD
MGPLQSIDMLQNFSILAKDGELGCVKDVHFDDRAWVIRHLVVDTGVGGTGRLSLISPVSVCCIDASGRMIILDLTIDQIRATGCAYIELPACWRSALTPSFAQGMSGYAVQGRGQRHTCLRSATELIGYDFLATDEAIGHVDDLLFDVHNWKIELMVVDTRNCRPRRRVVVPATAIRRVSWGGQIIVAEATRKQVMSGPEYEPGRPGAPRVTATGAKAGLHDLCEL